MLHFIAQVWLPTGLGKNLLSHLQIIGNNWPYAKLVPPPLFSQCTGHSQEPHWELSMPCGEMHVFVDELVIGSLLNRAPHSFSPLFLLILCPQASPSLSSVSHRLSGLFLDNHFFWFCSGHLAPWGFWIQSLRFSSLFCFRTESENCDYKMLSLHSLFVSIAWAIYTGETLKPSPPKPSLSPFHEVKALQKNAGRKTASSVPGATKQHKVQLGIFPTVSRLQTRQGKVIPWGSKGAGV